MSLNCRNIAICLFSIALLGMGNSAFGQDRTLGELYGRGVHSYFANDFETARIHLTTAIEQGSRDPRCYYFRGLSNAQLGFSDEAEKDFLQGARLEITTSNTYPIGRSLERVQGAVRIDLETQRQLARTESRNRAIRINRSRYEQFQRDEQGALLPPQPSEIDVPEVPRSAEDDPFSGDSPDSPLGIGAAEKVADNDDSLGVEKAGDEEEDLFGEEPRDAEPLADDPFAEETDNAIEDPFSDEDDADDVEEMEDAPDDLDNLFEDDDADDGDVNEAAPEKDDNPFGDEDSTDEDELDNPFGEGDDADDGDESEDAPEEDDIPFGDEDSTDEDELDNPFDEGDDADDGDESEDAPEEGDNPFDVFDDNGDAGDDGNPFDEGDDADDGDEDVPEEGDNPFDVFDDNGDAGDDGNPFDTDEAAEDSPPSDDDNPLGTAEDTEDVDLTEGTAEKRGARKTRPARAAKGSSSPDRRK